MSTSQRTTEPDEWWATRSARLGIRLLRVNAYECPGCRAINPAWKQADLAQAALGSPGKVLSRYENGGRLHEWNVQSLLATLSTPEATFKRWVRDAEASDDFRSVMRRRVKAFQARNPVRGERPLFITENTFING